MRIVESVNTTRRVNNDILKYKNLILKCLKGIRIPSYTTIEDIKQQAWLGLCIAKNKFNPTKNCKFITYAYYYVRGYINRMLYTNHSLLSHLGYETIKYHSEAIPSILPITDYDDDSDTTKSRVYLISCDNIEKVEKELDYYKFKKVYDKFFYLLSSKQKEVIDLYFFTLKDNGKHYTMRDIAEKINISTHSVSRRINNGCRILRDKAGKYLDVYI